MNFLECILGTKAPVNLWVMSSIFLMLQFFFVQLLDGFHARSSTEHSATQLTIPDQPCITCGFYCSCWFSNSLELNCFLDLL